jgi:hypothetical protein
VKSEISLFLPYIASLDYFVADAESRTADPDTEWSLSDTAFLCVSKTFGPFHMDLFASSINNMCGAYVSWFPDLGPIAIDTVTLSWEGLICYAFPPFILLPRILRKIVDDDGHRSGALVAFAGLVPAVPSSPNMRAMDSFS